MSFNLFLEHNDFAKSRRALFVSSVLLYVLSKLSFLSDEVQFFQLRLAVDQGQIVQLAFIASLYFFYIFLLKSTDFLQTFLVENRERNLSNEVEKVRGDLINFLVARALINDEEKIEKYIPKDLPKPINRFEVSNAIAAEVDRIKSDERTTRRERGFEKERLATLATIEDIAEKVTFRISRRERLHVFLTIMAEIFPPICALGLALLSSWRFVLL